MALTEMVLPFPGKPCRMMPRFQGTAKLAYWDWESKNHSTSWMMLFLRVGLRMTWSQVAD